METDRRIFTPAADGTIPGLFIVGMPFAPHELKTPAIFAPVFADEANELLVPTNNHPWEAGNKHAEIVCEYVDVPHHDPGLSAVFFEPRQARVGHAFLLLGPKEYEHREQIAAHNSGQGIEFLFQQRGLFYYQYLNGTCVECRLDGFGLWYGEREKLLSLRLAVWHVAREELIASLKAKDGRAQSLAFWLHRASVSLAQAALAAAVLKRANRLGWLAVLGASSADRLTAEQASTLEEGWAMLQSILKESERDLGLR